MLCNKIPVASLKPFHVLVAPLVVVRVRCFRGRIILVGAALIMSGLAASFWRYSRAVRNLALRHASVSFFFKLHGHGCRSGSFGAALIFIVGVLDSNLRLVYGFCSGLFSSGHFVDSYPSSSDMPADARVPRVISREKKRSGSESNRDPASSG